MAEAAPVAPPIPEGINDSILLLIDLSLRVFGEAGEIGPLVWATVVRNDFQDKAFQDRFASDLADAKWALGRFDEGSEPKFFHHLMEEFRLVLPLNSSAGDIVDIDHTLRIGEILLDSLQKFLEKFAYSALAVSVIKEMVKMARAINDHLKN